MLIARGGCSPCGLACPYEGESRSGLTDDVAFAAESTRLQSVRRRLEVCIDPREAYALSANSARLSRTSVGRGDPIRAATWQTAMDEKKSAQREEKALRVVGNPEALEPKLKQLGGSQSDDWNLVLANQAINAVWLARSDDEFQDRQKSATLAALVGIGPKDEIEGMMATQLQAAHNAAMECYRRAMRENQSLEGRRENLNQANKLSRTFTTLLEALNRYRGKGQQRVTVEHVHVHAGGQAVVGMVEPAGGGVGPNLKDQPHAKQIAHASQPPMWGADASRKQVQVCGDAERAVPDARRKVTGRSER